MPIIPFHKTQISDANQAIYNAGDCCLTAEIDEVRQNLKENDTLIYDFERSLQGPVLEMMLRGFKVDLIERDTAIFHLKTTQSKIENIISQIVSAVQGGTYNSKFPNSQKQLQNFFYSCMKLPPIERHINGEVKRPMNRETLEKLELSDKFAGPIINAILSHRDLSKSLQVLEKEIDSDSRWRCSYNIGGTNTGRFSSSESPFGMAGNFQNITENLRRVFIPDLGYKLYGIDKRQSEARDVGWWCGTVLGDWSYLDACESGDLHTYVTRLTYPEFPWTGNLKKDRKIADRRFYRTFTYRDANKRIGHASNYKGSPQEISRQTRVPVKNIEEFQERYFDAFPCIPKMHQWVPQELQRKRYLINSFGRCRYFFDRPDDRETIKSGIAYLFQSATADCLNLGMWRLWHRMGNRIQLLSQLHDAVYFQVKEMSPDDEKDFIKECLDCIEITQFDPNSGRRMKIPGEVVGGYNFAHRFRLKEDGSLEDWNPKGLSEISLN